MIKFLDTIANYFFLLFSSGSKEFEDTYGVPVVDPEIVEKMNFRKDITLILSAGHGSIDPVTGEYHCIASGKKYEFEDGITVYEGELNRLYSVELRRQAILLGYKVVDVHHEYEDISLSDRSKRAVSVSGETCLLAIHHNASPKHNAEGAEIFTSRGQTEADTLVDYIAMKLMMVQRFGFDLKLRTDITDGDYDKESGFYEIKKFAEYHKDSGYSGAHAYLELEFFDYLKNRGRLTDVQYIELICNQVLSGVDLFYKQRND